METTHITLRINTTTAANLRAIAQHETSGTLSHALREAIDNYIKLGQAGRNTNRSYHILSDLI